MDAPDLPNPGSALSRQVGPLTVGGWLVVGVVGVGAGLLIRRQIAGDSFTDPPALDTPDDGLVANTVGSGATIPLPQGAGPASVPSGPADNEEWVAMSVRWLSGMTPPVDALTAHRALEKFLDNEPLTTPERHVVSLAIGQFGTPPEGAAAAVNAPDPPTSKPAADHYTWKHPQIRPAGDVTLTGDGRATPAALSKWFYGSESWWKVIADANPSLHLQAHTKIPRGVSFRVP